MSRYIVIGHWGETIVREPVDATEPCTNDGDHPGHERCAQRVATVDSGAPEGLAERICALLNGDGEVMERDATTYGDLAAGQRRFLRHDGGIRTEPWDGDTPSGRPISPQAASGASGVVGSGSDDSEPAEAKCEDCGHPQHWHGPPGCWGDLLFCRCTRNRCICSDPPPTVDKPKNGTASRPPGWACPRHGTVI